MNISVRKGFHCTETVRAWRMKKGKNCEVCLLLARPVTSPVASGLFTSGAIKSSINLPVFLNMRTVTDWRGELCEEYRAASSRTLFKASS